LAEAICLVCVSNTVTVNEYVPPVFGTPLMVPLDESKFKPGGKLP
jgi:hypothetical protein